MPGGDCLKLFFDVTSPYAWIAFESLTRYEQHLAVPLKLIPVHLGFIMHKTGNHGPAAIPTKGAHMYRDLDMVSKYWGFSVRPPSDFELTIMKRGTLLPQRFLTAVDVHKPEYLRPLARELWSRVWCHQQDIHEVENIREVCKKVGVPDYEKLIQQSTTKEIKDLYKKRTDEVIEDGAFGVPWIMLSREGKEDVKIFGSDRLPIICDLLGKDYVGPLLGEQKSKL